MQFSSLQVGTGTRYDTKYRYSKEKISEADRAKSNKIQPFSHYNLASGIFGENCNLDSQGLTMFFGVYFRIIDQPMTWYLIICYCIIDCNHRPRAGQSIAPFL